MNQHPVGLKNAIINLNNAVDGLRYNFTSTQIDEVEYRIESLIAVMSKHDIGGAITMAESIYLGALLCCCKRHESIANKFLEIRERYRKQLNFVTGKEVWE